MAIAKAMLTCTRCGKVFEQTKKCFNRREADGFEAWAKENITVCRDCLREEARAAEQAKVDAATEGIQFPELTGTEKQVAWAEKIRKSKIAALVANFTAEGYGTKEYADKAKDITLTAILRETRSSYWIEHRDSANYIIIDRAVEICQADPELNARMIALGKERS